MIECDFALRMFWMGDQVKGLGAEMKVGNETLIWSQKQRVRGGKQERSSTEGRRPNKEQTSDAKPETYQSRNGK